MSRFVAIARLPLHEQPAAETQLVGELRTLEESDPIAVLLIPAIHKVSDASRRKHAYLRCLTVALASERYRRFHKKWPKSADQLCPQFLDAIPTDPFDGKPLRYRRVADGLIVYSLGSDGVDNDGTLDRDAPTRPGVDIGYRLWDVAKRRQPPKPHQERGR